MYLFHDHISQKHIFGKSEYVLLALLCCLSYPVSVLSQNSASDIPINRLSAVGGGVSSLLSIFDRPNLTQSDILFGNGTSGPYRLSWKGIHTGTETVWKESIRLHRDADYIFDYDSGSISFSAPLLSGQLIRIVYRCDRPVSIPNPPSAGSPLQMDIYRSGANQVTLRTFSMAGQGAGGSQSPVATLQYLSGLKLSPQSSINSSLYFDLRGGDLLDRSGFKLSESSKMKSAEFGLKYQRAGNEFVQGDLSGLHAGEQQIEANSKLHIFKGLTLTGLYNQTDALANLDSSFAGSTTRTAGGNFELTLRSASISGGRTDSSTTTPSGQNQTQITDSIGIDKTIRPGTTASLTYQSQSVLPTDHAAPQPGSYTQTSAVGIKSKVNKQLQVSTGYSNTISGTGTEDKTMIRLEAIPYWKWKDLKFRFNLDDDYQQTGVSSKREALLDLPILKMAKTKLSGGVQQINAPGQTRLAGLVQADTQPSRYLTIKTDFKVRDGSIQGQAPDPDAVNTYNMKASLSPWKRLQLVGGYSRNPEGSDGVIRKADARTFGLETDIGSFHVRGNYGIEDKYLSLESTNTMELGLDVHLTPWDILSSGLQTKYSLANSLMSSSTYLVAYKHKLGQFFDLTLSGEMTLNSMNGALQNDQTEMKANASFGLHF